MQKVEGSSPFSRLDESPALGGVFFCPDRANGRRVPTPCPEARKADGAFPPPLVASRSGLPDLPPQLLRRRRRRGGRPARHHPTARPPRRDRVVPRCRERLVVAVLPL